MSYRPPTVPRPFSVLADHPGATLRPSRSQRATDGWSLVLPFTLQVAGAWLHVGSGEKTLDGDLLVDRFARRDGKLVIPGTGIKGAIRSVVEAISKSCEPTGRTACQGPPQLCPACDLFGARGYRGRAAFSDAIPTSAPTTKVVPIAELWNKGVDHGGRRIYHLGEYQPPSPRTKVARLEAVGKGAEWSCRLRMDNVTRDEIGLILHAVGLRAKPDAPGWRYQNPVKLGKAKPRCLGATWFMPQAPILFDAPSGQGGTIADWVSASGLVVPAQLRAYGSALVPPEGSSNCPQEAY